MNSEKVKEIKNNLNAEIKLAELNKTLFTELISVDLIKDILTLINELESENSKLKQHKRELQGGQQDLTKRIAELEKENKDYYDRLNNLQTYIDNHEEIWKGNTNNALKRFAERLKEKLEENSPIAGYDLEDLEFDGETIQECIDATLKEYEK